MKDNDLLTYAALAVGGYIVYQKFLKKPAMPVASSVAVPVSANTTVTQAALPAASNTSNINNIVSSLATIFKPNQSVPDNNAAPLEAVDPGYNIDESPAPINTDLFKSSERMYASMYNFPFNDA